MVDLCALSQWSKKSPPPFPELIEGIFCRLFNDLHKFAFESVFAHGCTWIKMLLIWSLRRKFQGKQTRKMKLRFRKSKAHKSGIQCGKTLENYALSRNVLLPRVLDLVERTRICFTLGDNLRLSTKHATAGIANGSHTAIIHAQSVIP